MTDEPHTLAPYRLPWRRDRMNGQLKRAATVAAPAAHFVRRHPALLIGAAVVSVAGLVAWRNRDKIKAKAGPAIEDAKTKGRTLVDEARTKGRAAIAKAKAQGEAAVSKAKAKAAAGKSDANRADTPSTQAAPGVLTGASDLH